jgi:hypothetical protein
MTEATAGDIFGALLAGHHVGDYWAQTDAQARDKGLPGPEGLVACGRHVASLTACKALSVAVLHASGRRVRPGRAVLALAADAASHYWADRRSVKPPVTGLPRLAFAVGLDRFWMLGVPRGEGHDDNPVLGTGGHSLDQAFHILMLWVAALIASGGGDG